ncbi:MAG: metallophosphoesterase [Bryobacterales bacterium]|nr:metallophosphoesterase [Bryobacterales bacterium]
MIELHPSGALWLPEQGTALIADLHLGFTWAQRRRGELWPLTDGGAKAKLRRLCAELRPSTLVLVGDVVHAPNPAAEEAQLIQETLGQVSAELICVAGNHDRDRNFQSEWRTEGIRAIHGDVLPPAPEPGVLTVVGHFHPVMKLRDAAQIRRRHRAFLHGNGLVVLPAFSPFASGTDMRAEMPAELRQWFGGNDIEVTITSGEKLLPLGAHRLVRDSLRPVR